MDTRGNGEEQQKKTKQIEVVKWWSLISRLVGCRAYKHGLPTDALVTRVPTLYETTIHAECYNAQEHLKVV